MAKIKTQFPTPLKHEMVRFFRNRKEVDRVVLFGSRARGDASRTSDVDVAITAPRATNREWLDIYFYLKEDISSLLTFDVVRFEEAPLPLKRQIMKQGQLLFVRNHKT